MSTKIKTKTNINLSFLFERISIGKAEPLSIKIPHDLFYCFIMQRFVEEKNYKYMYFSLVTGSKANTSRLQWLCSSKAAWYPLFHSAVLDLGMLLISLKGFNFETSNSSSVF